MTCATLLYPIPSRNVGRTPRSARVPPDPPFGGELTLIHTQEADEGVGCGPGGPPHGFFKWGNP